MLCLQGFLRDIGGQGHQPAVPVLVDDMIPGEFRRGIDAGRCCEVEEPFPEGEDVVADAEGLLFDHECFLKLIVSGGNPDGTVVRMAYLSLDATDGEHEAPGDVDEVGSKGEGVRNLVGGEELPGCEDFHLVPDPMPDEGIVDKGKGRFDGYPRGIGELLIRCTGPAFSTVDGDEIGMTACFRHEGSELFDIPGVPDNELDADGFSTDFTKLFNEVEHAFRGIELTESVRAVDGLPRLHVPDRSDLGSDLLAVKMAAAGLGTLSELQFERFNFLQVAFLLEFFPGEFPVFRPHTE